MFDVIPAIDVIDGKCVRLKNGDFTQMKIYDDSPLETARLFENIGLRRLHVVDLDGAKSGKVTNIKVLEAIANNTKLQIDFGGGIKTLDDANSVFDAGAAFVNVGSIAVKSPEILSDFINKFGGNRILLGADALDGKIKINGWAENTNLDLLDFLRDWFEKGVTQSFCTDISRDGLLEGVSLGFYGEIRKALPELSLIASGGVSSMMDLHDLKEIGCSGAIVGKAIYENKITLAEIQKFNENAC
ncbi:MAG: 1-(5-phosphoribosyl)-5-[(5-phosphoribosylamino)methylideneamino]imidazole-4-carboxamide isomerase [Pyrinomonadaceae bacterium]|nr:1-(5-phosphoribosyl)-5-[(5-phosphoribosylamino)methylideneamino]imidazole-4-carboxamide isomerase [Pyrinomonadaceae bacterium]